jgi:hypothetical protein
MFKAWMAIRAGGRNWSGRAFPQLHDMKLEITESDEIGIERRRDIRIITQACHLSPHPNHHVLSNQNFPPRAWGRIHVT